MKRFTLMLLATACLLGTASSQATIFNDRGSFEAECSVCFTDGLNAGDGYPVPFAIGDSSSNTGGSGTFDMTDVTGQAVFRSTFHVVPNWNFVTGGVGDPNYCAGCNGSWGIDFKPSTQSLPGGNPYDNDEGLLNRCWGGGDSSIDCWGVDIESNSGYDAFVTYSDGTTENFDLGTGATFWGIVCVDENTQIDAIHFGTTGGGTTGSGSATFDNFTYGSVGHAAPASSPWAIAIGIILVLMATAGRLSRV